MPDLHIQFQDESASPSPPLTEDETLRVLETAEFVAEKLVPWGSNYTFAVGLTDEDGRDHLAIYKPQAGERPLWDFPRGTLYRRERASYLLSRWLGWDFVPPTIIREGPHGIGSLQLYVEPGDDGEDDPRFWGRRIPAIERMVMFDHIANNADRKIGHCLVDRNGRIWGIDHGLTFNVDPKLRTVLWQYSGEAIAPEIIDDLRRLQDPDAPIWDELREILDDREVCAVSQRVARLLQTCRYPALDPHVNVPYGWW